MLKVGFAISFPTTREHRARRHPAVPCETTHLFQELPNVLMTRMFSGRQMPRLKPVSGGSLRTFGLSHAATSG